MAKHDQIPDGLELTPFDADFYANPYPVYERLRRLDPVHKDGVSLFGESYTVSGHERVNRLLRDKRLSVDPRTIGLRRDPRADNAVTLREPDLMNLDGGEHTRLRALVQKAFTPTSVQQFAPRIDAIVDACLDTISGAPFDIVPLLAKPVPTIVIAEFIGVDSSQHARFKQWTDSLLLQGYPMPTSEQWDEIVDADAALRGCMEEVVAQRRATPKADLISRLIAAQEQDSRLTDREIVDMCYLLIGAGNFTTTDLISNSVFQLLSAKEAEKELESLSESLSETTINECIRADSSVLSVRRFVTEDVEIDGTIIAKGCVVNLLLASANHDPSTFDNAEAFVPQRTPNPHLSFGRGPHHCLGSALATLETSITVQKLMHRYPSLRVHSSKRSKRMDFRGFTSLVVG